METLKDELKRKKDRLYKAEESVGTPRTGNKFLDDEAAKIFKEGYERQHKIIDGFLAVMENMPKCSDEEQKYYKDVMRQISGFFGFVLEEKN